MPRLPNADIKYMCDAMSCLALGCQFQSQTVAGILHVLVENAVSLTGSTIKNIVLVLP